MKQTPKMRSSLGKEDLTRLWLIGPTRSFLFWNSSVHQIKDGITESGRNLEQGPNMIFSSRVSREWQETQKVKMKVGRLG